MVIHVKKAGAVIIKRGIHGVEVLLLYRAKQNDWNFPKGHIVSGETAEQAMRRELKEETSLEVDTLKQLPTHLYRNNVGELVTSMMFVVTTVTRQQPVPENERDILQWFPVEEVEHTLTHQNMKEYFQAIKIHLTI